VWGKVIFTLNQNNVKPVRLLIDDNIIFQVNNFVQNKSFIPESGGVLIGSQVIDKQDYILNIITVPQRNDIRKRYKYFRNKKYHQDIIDNIWLSSNGLSNYIGEWHTHPQELPEPSAKDINNWKKRIKHPTFYLDRLFFIILGTQHLRVWTGARGDSIIKELLYEKE